MKCYHCGSLDSNECSSCGALLTEVGYISYDIECENRMRTLRMTIDRNASVGHVFDMMLAAGAPSSCDMSISAIPGTPDLLKICAEWIT